ncbi:hypothetical protein Nepgr_000754 [Nepenthes gracilis]|uniref:Uncharacterized protein n=1 Tax=Nepenthes gracilis TaxID=150966 RepID=A0AAD3P4Y6_NEPGR|nr:hypothetical protein Nepgr_000754 [Nepenthes gracilis]
MPVARKLSQEFPTYHASYATLVGAMDSTVYVLKLLICTSPQDLGIIPSTLSPPEEALHYDSSVYTEIWGRTMPSRQFSRTKGVLANGVSARMKCGEICSNLIARTVSAAPLAGSFSGSDSLPLSDHHGGLDFRLAQLALDADAHVSPRVMGLDSFIVRYYFASTKELMRINGTTKSLVANHLAEFVAGVMTIRAFEEEDQFFAKNLNLIDKTASPFFHNFAASE